MVSVLLAAGANKDTATVCLFKSLSSGARSQLLYTIATVVIFHLCIQNRQFFSRYAGVTPATLNEQVDGGVTALCIASQDGHVKVVAALLAAGANKDAATASRLRGSFTAVTKYTEYLFVLCFFFNE